MASISWKTEFMAPPRSTVGKCAEIFQKSTNHLKILSARQVTRSKFHTKDTQIFGATVQNVVWHGDQARHLCTANVGLYKYTSTNG
jgi:hypothetical protein